MDNNKHLSSLLSILEKDNLSTEERQQQYNVLSVKLHDAAGSDLPEIVNDSSLNTIQNLVTSDILSSNVDIAKSALQVLGLCLYDVCIVKKFKKLDSVIVALCKVIINTTDKTCCTRALWCFSKQNIPEIYIKEKLPDILKAIEHGQCKKNFQSLTVEYEALCAIVRLLDQVPADMETHAVCWGKLVYPLLLHDAAKIRQQAMVAMDKGLDAMMKHQEELLTYLLPDLKPDTKLDPKVKSLLLSQMFKLMKSKLEVHVLKVWALYIKLLGKSVHHGSLINSLLPIVEQGFKNSSPEVKVMAYRAWKELINNFALNKDIISDPKRIKLVMQVFRINNARHESVALEKIDVWWHFVCSLKEAASLYFDVVCLPLLQYAISGQINLTGLTPGKTPTRLISANKGLVSPATPNLAVSGTGSPTQTFHSVQLRGCEMLAHILGKVKHDPDNYSPQFNIAAPEHTIIVGVAFFVKHHVSILGVIKQYLVQLGSQINDYLLHHIWQKTLDHVKNVIHSGSKHDSVDVLQMLLQTYEEIVENQVFPPEMLLKLLETLLSLPSQVLSSSSYSVGGTVLMQHNGALFLMGCMLHHRILETINNSSRFFTLFDKLVALALTNESSGLHVAEKILDMLQAAISNMEKIDNLAKLWMSLANPLNQLIQKTGDINQGTGLEYDFTCVLNFLTLPVAEILPRKPSQTVQNSVMKCWAKCYSTFARLAALVSTAPSNIACEEMMSRILPFVTKDRLKDEVFLNAISQLLITVLEPVDFSSISEPSHFGFTAGLGKLNEKKDSGLQNLVSFVQMMDKVLMAALDLAEQPEVDIQMDTKKPRSGGLSSTFINLIQILTTLFTHLVTSEAVEAVVIILSASLGRFYEVIGKKHRRGILQNTLTKAEKLWQDIATCLQARYTGHYDSDFLIKMLPLVKATFLHPRQKIKSQMLILWNLTFGRAVTLVYPDDLKSVLNTVKEKAAIILPGWNSSCVSCVQETPSSMLSQSESQVSIPDVIGVKSPCEVQGSFLKKVISENVNKSPLKPEKRLIKSTELASSPQNRTKSKTSLQIGDLKEEDFVVIQNSPKKKRVLTSHQKEVLKERSTIPALYSSIDGSQDLSLMAKFVSVESQMSMSDVISPSSVELCDLKNGVLEKEQVDKVDNPSSSPSKSSSRRKSVRFVSSQASGKENLSDTKAQSTETLKPCLATRKRTEEEKHSKPNETDDTLQDLASVIGKTVNGLEKSPSLEVDENLETSANRFLSAESQFPNSSLTMSSGESVAAQNSAVEKKCRASSNISQNSSLLDGITEETVSDVMMVQKSVQLQILAEESQMMPVKMATDRTSERCPDSDIIEETPQKEDGDGTIPGEVDFCSKKLFVVEPHTKEVIQDSQDRLQTETHGLVPYSETQSTLCSSANGSLIGSGDMIFDSVKNEVEVTPPHIPISLSSAQLSPVVSLQRLSSEEVMAYSPTCSVEGKEVKRRRSFRKKMVEKSSAKDNMNTGKVTTGLLFDDELVQPADQRGKVKPAEVRRTSKSSEDSQKTNDKNSTEANSDSVFIVEMCGDKEVVEVNSGSECTQSMESKNTKSTPSDPQPGMSQEEHSHAVKLSSQSSPVSSPRSSTRVRRVPRRLQDAGRTPSSTRKRRTSRIKSDFISSGENSSLETQDSASSLQVHPNQLSEELKQQDDESLEVPSSGFRLEGESTLVDDVSSQSSLFSSDDKDPGASVEILASHQEPEVKKSDLLICQSDKEQDAKDAGMTAAAHMEVDPEPSSVTFNQVDDEDLALGQDQCCAAVNNISPGENKNESLFSSEDELPLSALLKEESVDAVTEKKDSLQSNSSDSAVRTGTEKPTKSSSVRWSKVSLKRTKAPSSSDVQNRTRLSVRMQASGSRMLRSSKGRIVLPRSARRISCKPQVTRAKLKTMQKPRNINQVDLSENRHDTQSQITDGAQSAEKQNEVKTQLNTPEEQHPNADEAEGEIAPPEKLSQQQDSSQEPAIAPVSDDKEDGDERDKKKEAEVIRVNPEVGRPNKFVSPLRSPPRRGKLFSSTEIGSSSHSKHTLLSRASLILQRAKMSKPSSQPGRSPLSAAGVLVPERPGIMKSPKARSPRRPGLLFRMANQEQSSPSSFRPILLPRIYSPSASPSAGILRKRKLSGTVATDSPSPPNKQRRVCFNDTVETREIPSAQKHKGKARMVGRGSPKPVNRCLAMPQNGALTQSPVIHWPDSASKDDKVDSEVSESSTTVEVTPESQLNCKLPVCPEYIDCDIPIDCVLPQLTSTVWSAGLGQLIRAMDITTVGHLSALTEQEVHNLPIKSPKVETVREALRVVAGRKTKKANQKQEEKTASADRSSNGESESFCVSPLKDLDSSIGSTVCDPDIESHDLLDEIRQLDNSLKSTPPSSPESVVLPHRHEKTVLQELHALEKTCSLETLKKVPSSQLMEMFTSLNNVIGNVVQALKDKCPNSPNNSQS